MTIKQLISEIRCDLPIDKLRFKNFLFTYFFDASFRLLLNYRIGRYLSLKNNKISRFLGHYYKHKQYIKRGCIISYKAKLGRKINFPHPIGIVIGEGVIIEDGVRIWQQVTIGSHGKKDQNLEYPHIKEFARIYAGAKIIGSVTIGRHAIIGANAVVVKEVPDNAVVGGIPAKILTVV